MKTIWWINGCMNQWTNHSMNHWINDSNSPWINHWTNESIISNAMKHWANKPINQWINNPAKDSWTNERVNEFDGWVDGWMSELLFFVELLLHWATSSLRHLFSQLLLLWAASYLGYFFSDPALSCPQLWIPAAITMRLATSSCNPAIAQK